MITTTCPDKAVAEEIAKSLLEKKYAACVQILNSVDSYYVWNDAIENDREFLLFIKTTANHFSSVEKLMLEKHPYDTPQILAFETTNIHGSYADWLKNSVNK